MQFIFRFVVGGLIVSMFAVIGDLLKPKSFAGLFGAAPSVALATLGLTIHSEGKAFAALEARSMIVGAFAFLIYAAFSARLMIKQRWRAAPVTLSGLLVWLACSLGAWLALLR